MARTLKVEIVGNADDLQRAFGKAGRESSKFGSAMGKASKVAIGAFAALGVGAKLGFDELAESQRVSAQTAAVLESTGSAAKVTQASIEALAGALSKKSGVDDEAIQSGQNMLLTFTRIRNETGKGNDVFNQATKATLDLSVAMGKDMSSSAILVGKALNDPIKGMGALSKAGIQFTEAQKDQIKAMVESGDAMGAQKMILKELTTQFGGSAEAAGKTLTGSINKAKNAFSEMAASLVQALLPTLTQFAAFVQRASAFLTKHEPAVKVAIVALVALSGTVLLVNTALKLQAAATALSSVAFIGLGTSATLADKMMRLTLIGGLITLGTGLVIAYQKSETFRNVVNAAFTAVKNTVAAVISAILTGVDKWLGGLQMMMQAASKLPFVGDKFRGVAESVGRARDQVQALQGAIDGLRSKTIEITTVHKTYGQTFRVPGVAGSRAHGGPVGAGRTYLVGERGPELFTAPKSGMIIPNGGGRAGGGSVVQHFHFPNYVGDKQELVAMLRTELNQASSRNVGLAFG